MKLKYFSEQTLPRAMGGGRQGMARVTFSSAGMINLNKEAVQLIEVKEGNKLTIAQDEEEPENFYIFKDPQHGFALKAQKKGQYFGFYHKGLCQLIQEAKDLPLDKTVKALIAGQPTIMKGDKAGTKYWGLLVRPSV